PCLADGNQVRIYQPEVLPELVPEGDRPGRFRTHPAQNLTLPDPEPTYQIFEFPRQKSLRRLCIADFYLPYDVELNPERRLDVFPMQAVTVGPEATEFSQTLFADDRYTDYLYFYGLSVTLAEALAEWAHARIRRELGFGAEDSADIRKIFHQGYRGSRYSFGYPACPHIPDQRQLLDLLQSGQIGLSMDESDQLDPEQSTTALIAYHPEARYFNA
ncbi:MAG: vitamin B12 dependent-methionine synthase activation domain-containing protein, partial [Cyanobacteria bacterium J06648_11]